MNVELLAPALPVPSATAIATGTAIAFDAEPGERPAVLWTGAARTSLDASTIGALVGPAFPPPSVHAAGGRAVPLLPQAADDWPGRPALAGFREGDEAGRFWFVDLRVSAIERREGAVTIDSVDAVAGLRLRTEAESLPGGGVRLRHTLINDATAPYRLDWLDVVVPVPARAVETLDLTGRWGRERMMQRRAVTDGLWSREGHGGKTGADAATLLVAGTSGFGFGHGEVWGVHAAWSGNSRHALERLPDGHVLLIAGEALLPGEIVLGADESYSTPWVHVVASDHGLDGLSRQLHEHQRALPNHPRPPRPVTCNVWEAVYFDHDLERLTALARRAAEVGVERFVLDDGWFGSRRDDTRGLGDWAVSPEAWPGGLAPLVERVDALGMQFGLWFEPEMINADSDLYRAHPDWVLHDPAREPLVFRNQLVLDLANPDVVDHLTTAIGAVLDAVAVRYVKWDHNRYLVDGASPTLGGAAGAHAQTLGFYRLLDGLRARHPHVEWESCASGGARIDLGVIERVERFWTSDCTDALSRQLIQRGAGLLIAPEYLGAHVSAPVNHQTGRQFPLDFRVATAFFGDLGIEWDLTSASAEDRERLAGWIALYKQHRGLLHGGRTVRVDSPADSVLMYGVVAPDAAEAVFCYVQLDERVAQPVPFTITGLDADARYEVRRLTPQPADTDWAVDGVVASGADLATIGLTAPPRRPASSQLVHLHRV